jgi:uncharacterized membrane protein YkoI
MNARYVLVAALAAAVAMPAAAQSTSDTATKVQASKAARVDVKVNQSLANSAKISGDSAFAIARANADNGEVSSAKLETMHGRLVYNVNVLNKSKRASTVVVDAMTCQVLDATQHGGLKSTVTHAKENKRLLNAKRDSAAKNP